MTFERAIVVAAPRAWLFDLMQDYDRRLEWDVFLSEARLVGGARKADKHVRAWCVDRRGRGMETEYVSFDPPNRVAVRMTRGPWYFERFAGSWIYEDDPAGTRVVFRYHIKAHRWIVGGDRVLARVFAHHMTKRLTVLKHRLERLAAVSL